jgi:hypothetical protein
LECDGEHATLRRSKARFNSWQGQSLRVWRTHGGVRSRKAGSDSQAGDLLSSECVGRARDFAKVEDRVQFPARTCSAPRWLPHFTAIEKHRSWADLNQNVNILYIKIIVCTGRSTLLLCPGSRSSLKRCSRRKSGGCGESRGSVEHFPTTLGRRDWGLLCKGDEICDLADWSGRAL